MSGVVEALARRERLVVPVLLALACALAWVFTLNGAGMGMSAWQMSRLALFPHESTAPTLGGVAADAVMPGMAWAGGWTVRALAMLVAMWWVMMMAMMLPAAAPLILLHGGMVRHAARRKGGAKVSSPAAGLALLGGYAAVWLGFSVLAVVLQVVLIGAGLISAGFLWSDSRLFSAVVLALAAAYQFAPLKRSCLTECRGPVTFLSSNWRPGAAGAFRLGVLHGWSCLGCCWALMLLLFVGGVMNVVWIAALGLLALAERHLPGGVAVSYATGGLLALWAVATLLV